MEAIYWQTAYGDKEQLFEGITDPALLKYLSINYGPWDRLDANRPFLETAGPKPLGANFYPQDMTKSESKLFRIRVKPTGTASFAGMKKGH